MVNRFVDRTLSADKPKALLRAGLAATVGKFNYPALLATLLILASYLISVGSLHGSRIELIDLDRAIWAFTPISALLGIAIVCPLVFRRHFRIAWASWYLAAFVIGIFGTLLAQYAVLLRPRWDISPALVAADRAFGFDWPAYSSFIMGNQPLALVLDIAYASFQPEYVVLVAVLLILDRRDRMVEHTLIAAFCYAMTLVIFGLFPAQVAAAAYNHQEYIFDKNAVNQISTILSGGNVTIREPTGIIAFPSLHTEGALLFMYLTRGLVIFYPGVVLNLLMIASIPVFGSHFMVDVLAGGVTFAVGVAIARKICAGSKQPVMERAG